MKRRNERLSAYREDVVFQPALMPMEAAMLPARERPQSRGALHMARRAFEWDQPPCPCAQRQKIWVR